MHIPTAGPAWTATGAQRVRNPIADLVPGRYHKDMRPRDTSPEAWKVFLDLVRRMSPEERLQRAIDLTAAVRNLGEANIREAHPGASEREIFLRAARRRLGADLYAKVYGAELPL